MEKKDNVSFSKLSTKNVPEKKLLWKSFGKLFSSVGLSSAIVTITEKDVIVTVELKLYLLNYFFVNKLKVLTLEILYFIQ